jgi:hypothetical protein
MKRLVIIVGTVVALVGFTAVSRSAATAELELYVLQGGVQLDTQTMSAGTTFAGAVGDYTVNFTSGITSLGTSTNPVMDIVSLNATALTATTETLVIELSSTGFKASPLGISLQIGGTNGLLFGPNGSVTYSAYYDTTDTLFGKGSLIGSTGALTGSPFGGTAGGTITSPSDYSITQIVSLAPDAGGNPMGISFDAKLTATPEPASLFLVGSALAGLGIFRCFKKKA